MKHEYVSPYVARPLRSLADVLAKYEPASMSWDDWCNTRLTARDFIAECGHADGRHHHPRNWRKLFFACLRKRLAAGESFEDALDATGYQDATEQAARIEQEAEEEARAERAHENYCRSMCSIGPGW